MNGDVLTPAPGADPFKSPAQIHADGESACWWPIRITAVWLRFRWWATGFGAVRTFAAAERRWPVLARPIRWLSQRANGSISD